MGENNSWFDNENAKYDNPFLPQRRNLQNKQNFVNTWFEKEENEDNPFLPKKRNSNRNGTFENSWFEKK